MSEEGNNNNEGVAVAEPTNVPVAQPWEALGFSTFEAFNADQMGKLSKLEKQVSEDQKMVQRQAQELGDLRKAEAPPIVTEKQDDDMEVAKAMYAGLNEQQKTDANDKLQALSTNIGDDAKSGKAMKLLLEQLFPDQARPATATSMNDLLGAKPAELTLEEQIKGITGGHVPARPVAPASHGMPAVSTQQKQQPKKHVILTDGLAGLV